MGNGFDDLVKHRFLGPRKELVTKRRYVRIVDAAPGKPPRFLRGQPARLLRVKPVMRSRLPCLVLRLIRPALQTAMLLGGVWWAVH